MKQILLFGAGKSATVLIDYLLEHSAGQNWQLIVADANLQLAKDKIKGSQYGKAVSFDIMDDEQRSNYIRGASIVISMLPPHLHSKVARDCVKFSRNLLTASYVDDEMRTMKDEIKEKGLLFICEMGLDPGIDHMSAMKLFDEIRDKNGTVTAFRSHCGGLVAPESDDNPWHYKISWNPRNIIMAGKAGAHYLDHGKEIRLTHGDLFQPRENLPVEGCGPLTWYPNRDSLSYAGLYGLENTATFIRTTLRHPDFMHGWNKIIAMKLTEEQPVFHTNRAPLSQLIHEHLERHGLLLSKFTDGDSLFLEQLEWLGFLDEGLIIQEGSYSAADLLQFAVEKKLGLKPRDKDMIVMLHEITYLQEGKSSKIESSLVVKGEDNLRTAMAKTVGLPLGIAARLIMQDEIKLTGLHIPTAKEIYEPVLKELNERGIVFNERLVE